MDISHLIYFKEVAEQGSLSKAAQSLYVSQPALSVSISKIEAEVGVPLFDRIGKRIILNRAGGEYYQYVCEALNQLQQGRKKAQAIAEGTRNLISLGAFTYVSFSTITIPFLNQHPECKFKLLQLDGNDIVHELIYGDVDFAFTCLPVESRLVNCHHLLSQKLYLTVPYDHPLASKSYVKLSDIRYESFILLDINSPLRAVTDNIFREAGFIPKIAYEVTQSSLMAGMINSGEGISLLPDTFSEHKNLRKISILEPQAIHNVYFVFAKDKELSPAAQAFLDFTMDFYKDYPKNAR
ncbi:MAG: LysR family transcriptional regulator, partial [Eubacteriales bacterium]|nr:LysR family transcriptional regulator [Eubacteriales bacterium]